MKRIYNYVILSVFAFAAVACLDDELNQGGDLANLGNEVQFGLSLNYPTTKTIYGPENESGTAYPIYWSEGDVVKVASPQCVTGRKEAEYLVTPMSGQNFAQAMTKVGAYGVQWGGTETADFYSVYPSSSVSFTTLNENKVVARLHIDADQSSNVVLTNGEYISADMDNVIMYAQTNDVENGSTVNLKYIPYSTMLEFDLGLDQGVDPQGNPALDKDGNPEFGTVKVTSMTLTAPGVALAGDFNLTFNGDNAPVIENVNDNNSNVISLNFTTYPVLDKTNRTLKVKMSMIPLSEVQVDGWTIEINALDGKNNALKFAKTLTVGANLAPGQIHKIKLPRFRLTTAAWNPETDEWITTLYDYKNIYITELSLPGAWYAGAPTKDGYQTTTSMTEFWNAGIRAFAVECRTATGGWGNRTPANVVVSGSGGNQTPIGGSASDAYYYNGTKIRDVIKDIANAARSSLKYDEKDQVIDGEFAVLVLSYADGGKGGHRPQDYSFFINGIKNEIANCGVSNVYSGQLDATTTVADVLGQVIIKVNVDSKLPIGTYDGTANMLLSYNPFLQQLTGVDYAEPMFSKLYWKTWSDDNKVLVQKSDDFLWCFASANRTQDDSGNNTTIPTYKQRQTALRGMITHSKELTSTGKHNVWFYFNAGGVLTTSDSDTNTSATDFATTMNEWLYNLLYLKGNGGVDTNGVFGTEGALIESDPSPLGIVMFNQCLGNTYNGENIIHEIISMNNKFKLLRANQDAKSAAPSYASGMKSSDSAFGWD